jgi:hypothetical protein
MASWRKSSTLAAKIIRGANFVKRILLPNLDAPFGGVLLYTDDMVFRTLTSKETSGFRLARPPWKG